MKNKISSNDILIIRNTIIWSGHDNEQKRVQGQKVYVSLERDGIAKTRISFSVEFDWGVERASTRIFPEYISRAHVNIIL